MTQLVETCWRRCATQSAFDATLVPSWGKRLDGAVLVRRAVGVRAE
jgi:hypothetical protein